MKSRTGSRKRIAYDLLVVASIIVLAATGLAIHFAWPAQLFPNNRPIRSAVLVIGQPGTYRMELSDLDSIQSLVARPLRESTICEQDVRRFQIGYLAIDFADYGSPSMDKVLIYVPWGDW